ncbi:MAG: PAS domain S-box protein [Gemmatimonadaceae bacterium]|nr:PAS domain S-box protein [Gemmatimonadaceae bacterium]
MTLAVPTRTPSGLDRFASLDVRQVVGAMSEGVVVQHADGTIRGWNPRAEEILGLSGDELSGRGSTDPPWLAVRLDGSPFPATEHPSMQTLRTGRPVWGTVMGVHKPDGTLTWINVNSTPIVEGGAALPTAVVTTFTDISRQVHAEQVLRAAKEAAELANRSKSAFLARMSHELRTPLNSVIGFATLLLSRRRTNGEGEHADSAFLERIRANGTHLLTIINDILDLSQVEAGRVTVRSLPVDLRALVLETVGQLADQAQVRGLQLTAEIPDQLGPVMADADRLRQVLINLLGNALKFTPTGDVVVRVRADVDGEPTSLEVQDSGIGIPFEVQSTIFEPFEQGDTTTARKFGGTGLGLAIARQLCELMGFRLHVRSAPGEGSRFTVEFARL